MALKIFSISAGDETKVDFGTWASPFVGNSTQKAQNNLSGYKSNSTGSTVGFDS
ncbi:outer membrane protein A [Rickettsia conorii subsp. heilongjiangensis 054]|uniref:autotransporter outer membrane beta-barrel domain-containing protein n=1 Tax=Rickettsia conorii TaxID=781 RepID=UPI000219E392|nr:autotransporter outer membrane beta-barrel domain-containing protein [Rickettsia conorii]AEK74415.1 outer membrane protein A [Rickettsia conorii subsp. heilongjiangensis 054]